MRILLFLFAALPLVVFGQTDYHNSLYIPFSYSHNELSHDCFGLGAGYERMLGKKEKFSVDIPVTIGLPGTSNKISFLSIEDGHKMYSSFSIAPGVKFFTGTKKAKVRYAVGLSGFYETGEQNYWNDDFGGYVDTRKVNYSFMGYMLSNSLYIYPAKHFLLAVTLSTGFANQGNEGHGYTFSFASDQYSSYNGPGFMAQLQLKAGYRY